MASHTVALLKISHAAYIEIRDAMEAAGYTDRVFELDDPHYERLSMVGIALSPKKGCSMPSHHWDCDCNGMGGDR